MLSVIATVWTSASDRSHREDDLGWVVRGIDYLLRVDADTTEKQRKLTRLRAKVSERIRRSAGGTAR